MNRVVWFLLSLFMLSFVAAASPPTIVTQPESETVLVGMAVELRVVAAGEDLTYQWQRNAVDIPGATAASYRIARVDLADSGATFSVRVANDKGTATSCIGASSTSSGGSSGAQNPDVPTVDPGMFAPYPVTRWKGSVKVTRVQKMADIDLTTVIEGEVTFESNATDIGLHPTTLQAVEGSLTLRRSGTGGGCTDTVDASGTIKQGEGMIDFTPRPDPPQQATELAYHGLGNTLLAGTQVRSCPAGGGTTSTNWTSHEDHWLMTGEQVTSPDLLVISGTNVMSYGTGTTLTYEWNLVKQR